MDLQLVRRKSQAAALAALSTIRQEWEQAAEGESLVQVQASVGLLLLDVTTRLRNSSRKSRNPFWEHGFTEKPLGKLRNTD